MSEILECWCGNTDLQSFSPGYLLCKACETLVAVRNLKPETSRVKHDDKDFYGREYWFSHQKEELGFSDITDRARAVYRNDVCIGFGLFLNTNFLPEKSWN